MRKDILGFRSSVLGSDWRINNDGLSKPACEGKSGTSDPTKNSYWVFPTGLFKNSRKKTTEKRHVFDVLGNVSEYTTEVAVNCNKVVRSSSAICDNYQDKANTRNGNLEQPEGWASLGFRIVLYVE